MSPITKYQMALVNIKTHEELVLGYTARKTKRSLFESMAHNGADVLALMDASVEPSLPDGEEEGFLWDTKEKAWAFASWRVRFSGVTLNDVNMAAKKAAQTF